MADYLKKERHYIDLYDLSTIKRCLKVIKLWGKVYEDGLNSKELKYIPKEKRERDFNRLFGQHLYVEEGERYRIKKDTIHKWIEDDRVKQEKFDNTPRPQNIYCTCGGLMQSAFKHLEDFSNQPLRVLFFFECPNCKKRKGVYDNGEERIPEPNLCPKCGREAKTLHTKKGEIITWVTTCSCGFKETKVDDFEKDRVEWKKKEEEDKGLLEKYRGEFCLSDEEGQKYIKYVETVKYAHEVLEEEKSKYDNSSYQAAVQARKFNVVELEKLLNKSLEEHNYIKLSFDKPEMSQFVIVPFTVQDADSSRKELPSVDALKTLIKDVLEDTNWKLMSEGVHYRLGYLSGRLRGYEREEDLMELSGKRKQKSVEDDYERRIKYGGDPLVNLARMIGKHEGIENTRKKRLGKEPDGFFLEASEGIYTCAICKQNTPGNNIWWNLDGLRCADCWRNIQEGVIPSLSYSRNDEVWIKDSDIRSDYSIQSGTRKSLEREGILRGRQLKRQDGATYCTVYLVEENKRFFKKYPKKPLLDVKFSWSEEKESMLLNVKKN